jgi:hypothetical protein
MSNAHRSRYEAGSPSGAVLHTQIEPPATLALQARALALPGCPAGMTIIAAGHVVSRPDASQSRGENSESDSTVLRTVAVLLAEAAVWIGSALVGSVLLTALR